MISIENSDDQSIEWYKERIECLAQFMTPEREKTLVDAVAQRTKYMTICTENTFHPQNASALMRTCEAFGVQEMHAIEELCSYKPNVRIVRGTDKWLKLHKYGTTPEAVARLKADGYRIVATMPHTDGKTPETFDVEAGKFALVFGTEHAGVSQEIVESADDFIRIPMYGLVESLNVSACASILVYMLASKLRASDVDWKMDEHEQAKILFIWMMESVKDSKKILEKKFPKPVSVK